MIICCLIFNYFYYWRLLINYLRGVYWYLLTSCKLVRIGLEINPNVLYKLRWLSFLKTFLVCNVMQMSYILREVIIFVSEADSARSIKMNFLRTVVCLTISRIFNLCNSINVYSHEFLVFCLCLNQSA